MTLMWVAMFLTVWSGMEYLVGGAKMLIE